MKPLLLALSAVLYTCSLYSQQWKELNPSDNLFNNTILSTVADKKGNVYAAGRFTDSAREYAVAVLAGGRWAELGGAVNTLHAMGAIYSLTLDTAGNLYAGGAFTDQTGNYYVAKWNGDHWSETGTGTNGQATGQIFCLAADNQGDVFAGGELIDASGNYYISEWNGSTWVQVGTGTHALHANGLIYSMLTDATRNVYAAGHFTNAGGKYYVAEWNGSDWSEVGNGAGALNANGYIASITSDAAGNLYAAGDFTDPQGEKYVAKWDGISWTEVGVNTAALHANGTINSIVFDTGGHLSAAGWFTDSIGYSIAQWSGTGWSNIPAAAGFWPNQPIYSLSSDQTGNLYAAGDFTDINGDRYVARLSGGTWSEPGIGGTKFPTQANPMRAVAVDTAGLVYVVLGDNDGAGIPIVEKWDGSSWSRLSTDIGIGYASLSGLAADSSGNIYACGEFGAENGVAKWNGQGWTMLPNSAGQLTINSISHIGTDKKGNVYISGSFLQNNAVLTLAKWDGTSWHGFASDYVYYFIVDSSGVIYAANADFTNTGYNVLKITEAGSTRIGGTGPYQLNANNWVHAMALDAVGNLYIGGGFQGSNSDAYVARWDGHSWTVPGGGTGALPATGAVQALAFDAAGNLYASGNLMKNSGAYMGKWDGQSWTAVSNGSIFAGQYTIPWLCRDERGIIYAGGGFNGSRGPEAYIYSYADNRQPTQVCNFSANVKLVASQTSVGNQGGPVVLTAIFSGSGTFTNTTFTFATDRDYHSLLAAPSADSILSIAASDLAPGANLIYVKMQTTNSCNSTLTVIDSITITKNDRGGLVDGDYPNTSIVAYPNPVDKVVGVTGLSSSKAYDISIFNINGLKVASVHVRGQTGVMIQSLDLQPGIYRLEVYDDTKNRKIGIISLLKTR